MSFLNSFPKLCRLAAATALLLVSDAAPNVMPGGAPDQAMVGSHAFAAQSRLLNFAHIPLCFEANRGQTDAQVQFLARSPGYTVFLTSTEAVLALGLGSAAERSPRSLSPRRNGVDSPPLTLTGRAAEGEPAVLRMQLVGGNRYAQARGLDRLPGFANYMVGKDPSKWRTHIPTYARVQYQDVYTGVSLVYYGNQRQLEYDFLVAPGADPQQIRLGFVGAQQVGIDGAGDLVVQAKGKELRQHRPFAYQEIAGRRQEVKADFVIRGQQVAFALGHYDPSKLLLIDPSLSYSTYLGGSGEDQGSAIAVDAAGNVYVTGQTGSSDFPTVNALQPAPGGTNGNVFVAKLSADGSTLIYSTYVGGSGKYGDAGNSIAVDASGSAYVAGGTTSSDFPTVNPLQPALGGPNANGNAFVAKLSPDGSELVYSTYLGGSNSDTGYAIALDPAGDAYVTGFTVSSDFPTVNSLQPVLGASHGNAFVAKLNADGSTLVYSTYLGGSNGRLGDYGDAIAVDASGSAYVTGATYASDFPTVNPLQPALGSTYGVNAFVAKFTSDGSALVYSTYLGGNGGDAGGGIAVDAAGSAYVTGTTTSRNFPTVNPLQPAMGNRSLSTAFVAKLSADGSTLVYSTFLGGSDVDMGNGIAVDPAGNAFVTGATSSSDFPTVNALQPALGGPHYNAFVAKLSTDGSTLVYSTYLGGRNSDYGHGIALGPAGDAYVTGITQSPDFPTVNPLQPALGSTNGNAFVAKISP